MARCRRSATEAAAHTPRHGSSNAPTGGTGPAPRNPRTSRTTRTRAARPGRRKRIGGLKLAGALWGVKHHRWSARRWLPVPGVVSSESRMHTTNRERTAIPGGSPVTAPRPVGTRNVGTPLELDWIREVRINRSAVERRTATIPRRRTVKTDWQVAWLLRAVTLVDLTTLSGDDTPGKVRRLCAKARQPVRQDVLAGFGASGLPIRVAAVCVYHAMVETAVEALEGSGIPVAAVSTGFPAGLNAFPQRLEEIRASVEAGADEIDVVITRAHALTGDWPALYDEVRS